MNIVNRTENFNRSEKMKELWEKGVFKRQRTSDYKSHMSELTKAKIKEGKIVTPTQRYQENMDPRLIHVAKGPRHHRSKFWKFESPIGTIIEGTNLSEIVRCNIGLFLVDDLKPAAKNSSQCRAVTCMAQLKYRKEDGSLRRTHWKGWKLLLIRDVKTGEIEFEN